MPPKIPVTKELSIIESYYRTKNSMVEVADLHSVGASTVYCVLKRYGLKSRPQQRQPSSYKKYNSKYEIDESFFDIVNVESKAYILGLLYADGCNNVDRGAVAISLQEGDVDILCKIRDLISPDRPLYYRKDKKGNRKPAYVFSMSNRYISDKLNKLGCMQKKTLRLIFPEWLEEDLIPHFIRGYFDGDGYFGYYEKDKRARWQITSTKDFCDSVKNIFRKTLDINSVVKSYKPEKCNPIIKNLQVSGNVQIYKLMDWLYGDATVYMDRKYNKFLEFKKVHVDPIYRCVL